MAQYEIEVMNPEGDPDRGAVAEIEQALGCPVRLIWQRLWTAVRRGQRH